MMKDATIRLRCTELVVALIPGIRLMRVVGNMKTLPMIGGRLRDVTVLMRFGVRVGRLMTVVVLVPFRMSPCRRLDHDWPA
jgi:hypothetical protein